MKRKLETPPFASGMFDMFRWVAATIVLACNAPSLFYGSYFDIDKATVKE